MTKLTAVLLACAIAGTSASRVSDTRLGEPALQADMITMINNANAGWTAGENMKFAEATLGDVKKLCGAITEGEKFEAAMARLPKADIKPLASLPSDFDSRTKWSNCSSVIGQIRDQASCGSCWAVSSTEAFNDRKCITTGGEFLTELSAQDTTSCCNLFGGCFGSQGCNGGMPAEAWQYFTKNGLVTGGEYDSIGKGKSCFPYQLPNCNHHEGGPYPECKEGGNTPACPSPKKCSESTYAKAWGDDKTYAKSAYGVSSDPAAIQTEIMSKGPVTAAFSVYEDFITYRSGVYKHTTGQMLGGHAVKILGWGVENGQDYWLVANSWNVNWGLKGYFKIARGVDECGIEDQIVAGDV